QENIIIKGVETLYGARVSSFGDHRTAMRMVIAGLAACGKTRIDDLSCIRKSFPDFLATLNSLK
ncbi:MAG: 3-phosphoshikimate 1-carboxyvinyltransferase, partial [Candidatus Omnitrophota bacterium]